MTKKDDAAKKHELTEDGYYLFQHFQDLGTLIQPGEAGAAMGLAIEIMSLMLERCNATDLYLLIDWTRKNNERNIYYFVDSVHSLFRQCIKRCDPGVPFYPIVSAEEQKSKLTTRGIEVYGRLKFFEALIRPDQVDRAMNLFQHIFWVVHGHNSKADLIGLAEELSKNHMDDGARFVMAAIDLFETGVIKRHEGAYPFDSDIPQHEWAKIQRAEMKLGACCEHHTIPKSIGEPKAEMAGEMLEAKINPPVKPMPPPTKWQRLKRFFSH